MPRTTPFLGLLLAAALAPAAAQQASPATPAAPHDTVIGAIQKVDARTRTLEVTTGIGMALRVVRLQVPPAAQITAQGAALRFELLMPGDVLRVAFGRRPAAGYVAYTIERVGTMTSGQEPSP